MSSRVCLLISKEYFLIENSKKILGNFSVSGTTYFSKFYIYEQRFLLTLRHHDIEIIITSLLYLLLN